MFPIKIAIAGGLIFLSQTGPVGDSRRESPWIMTYIDISPVKSQLSYPIMVCTLWIFNVANWKITIFHGKIHYFYGHFQ